MKLQSYIHKLFSNVVLVLFFFSASLFISSCSKKNGSGITVEKGKMSATVSGKKVTLNIYTIDKKIAGDTTTIIIEGQSSDSTVFIGLYFNEILRFKSTTYFCGLVSDSSGGFVQAGYFNPKSDTSYICDGIGSKGSISVSAYSTDIIQGSFSFDAKNPDDSVKVVKISGQFNCSINDFVNGSDLPIALGKMWAQPDGGSSYFNVIAGNVTRGNEYELDVTGSSGQKAISIEFLNFTPKINVEYTIGMFDTSAVAGVKASYVRDAVTTFYADGTNGSTGKIKLAKLTKGNIQGVFQFTGVNINNVKQRASVTSGMFNSKLKNY